MNIYTEELRYMNETLTQKLISDITGIPQATLSYVLSGQRDLPEKYNAPEHYQYSQYTYDILRKSGANNTAALLNAGLPPDEIRDQTVRWEKVIWEKTQYRIASELYGTGLEYTQEELDRLTPDRLSETIIIYAKLSVDLTDAENNVWYIAKIEI